MLTVEVVEAAVAVQRIVARTPASSASTRGSQDPVLAGATNAGVPTAETAAVPAAAAGARTAGARTAGARTAGARTAGAETAGARTAGVSTGGRTAGTRTAGAETDAARTVGVRIAGARTAGSRTAGARTAGAEAAGAKMARARTAGAQLAGARKLQARAGWSGPQNQHETLSPQQLRERYARRSGGGGRSGSRCVAVQLEVTGGVMAELQRHPRETLMPHQIRGVVLVARTSFAQGVDIFALDYDAILTAMYALTIGTEGDCSLCVLPDPGIEAAALGASESALPGLHFPSFSTNLVSTAALQDAMVITTTPGSQRVSICTCTRTGRHPSTFTRRPGSTPYTLATEPPQVAASGPVAPPCSCRLLTHQTLLRHHRLGHSSLPRLVACTPASLSLVFLGICLPSRPCLPRPPFLASRGGSAPLLTPPRFPRRLLPCRLSTWTKGQAVDVLIPSIQAVRLQLRERFHQDLPVLHLHSDRGVMEVARTSMIHAAALRFLWPFAVRYAAHQLNLWPRVCLLETSPALHWTGKVGDASVLRVWGSRTFVRDTSADKPSARAIPCVFLGFSPDAHGWQFYHPTSRRVFPSQDVTLDESVPFYRLFPYRSAPPPPPLVFLAPSPPLVDPLPPQGPGPSAIVSSAASRGAASWGAKPGGGESEGARSRGTEPGGAEPRGAEPAGVESG
ncbi:unnamed protein product, partial [Closterium sp. NIES-54]